MRFELSTSITTREIRILFEVLADTSHVIIITKRVHIAQN